MKKVAALVLTLALLLISVSALAVSPADVVGSWYVVSMTANYGADFGPGIPLNDYHLDLNRDGSALLVFNGVEREYGWEVTEEGAQLKPLSEKDDEYTNYFYLNLTLTEENTLTLNTSDFGLEDPSYFDFVFAREPVDKTLPALTTAAQEDDFFGDWVGFCLVQDDMIFDVSALGLTAKVEYAQITLSQPESDPITVLTDYADGVLTSEGKAFAYNADAIRYELTDAGSVCATLSDDGTDLYSVYFVKADEAAASEENMIEEVEEAVEAAEEEVIEAVEEFESEATGAKEDNK